MDSQGVSNETMTDEEYFEYDAGYDAPEDENPAHAYRSVSKCAVFSLVLAIMALSSLLFPGLMVLSVVGVLLGIVGLWQTQRLPDELTGFNVAVLGTLLGMIVFGVSATRHAYIYATEVPDGYRRISFSELQFDLGSRGLTESIRQLDGQRIFVKGYVHPGVSSLGEISQFVLVPDMQTCCFGGQPKMSDMIEVKIVSSDRVTYSRRKLKLGGTFRVHDQVKEVAGGLKGGLFELEADYVKK